MFLAMGTGRVYHFHQCEVDADLRQIRVAGVAAEPQPKVFDLLLYLIEHRDRVVDKDELLAKIWPGTVVSESALTQAVRKARAMVADDGVRQAVIRTVQRRGFRFVAPLDDEPAPAAPPAIGGAPPSVAVLPFADMSPDHDQEYFCDGMAEEIINELVMTTGLRVAARTSSFAFRNRNDDVRLIGRSLGVGTILQGSVRKDGDRLRVTAQLIDAETGFHLWSERWERQLASMFDIQDEIARGVAEALRAPGAGTRPVVPRPAPTAADLYQRGLVYLHRLSRRSQRFAIELFQQALALDPRFGKAWAGLAGSHVMLYRYAEATAEHLESATRAAARAIELEPLAPESWVAQGGVYTLTADFENALAAFQRSIELGPGLFEAHYYCGRACYEMGRYEQAAALFERAAALRPDDYQALVFASQAYQSLGQKERARDALRRQLVAAERALAEDPTDTRALVLSIASLVDAGRRDEARDWIARAEALDPDEPNTHYNVACAYLHLGEIDRALDSLDRLDFSAMANRAWMEHDEDLEPLRGHPRFKAMMARTR
jgi:adenylate cyclase